MEKKTLEDTYGIREYSLQKSVRIINKNPDMKDIKIVSCSCGEPIDRRTDWYVMIANGMIQCYACANCSSCRRVSTNRRLVCIDGLVLCHDCLENFGYPLQPAFRIRIDDPNGLVDPANASNTSNTETKSTPATSKTVDVLSEYRRKDRCQFRDKADGRRPLRRALYERQAARLPDERNPLLTSLPYDATRGSLERMVCPTCSKLARGHVRYVVPSIGRVYHKSCFVCQACREPMSLGMQVAGRHFELCSCEPPQVWCTRHECKLQRMTHHETSKCWLGSLKPGGREQRDTDVSAGFQAKKSAKADGKATQSPAVSPGAPSRSATPGAAEH